jgi:hypothetical protein
MAESKIPELNPVEIVEISNTVVRISEELKKIEHAVEQLKLAYGNAARHGVINTGSVAQQMMDSRAFTALNAKREELRQALYELG